MIYGSDLLRKQQEYFFVEDWTNGPTSDYRKSDLPVVLKLQHRRPGEPLLFSYLSPLWERHRPPSAAVLEKERRSKASTTLHRQMQSG